MENIRNEQPKKGRRPAGPNGAAGNRVVAYLDKPTYDALVAKIGPGIPVSSGVRILLEQVVRENDK
jgi:hypothetical protein